MNMTLHATKRCQQRGVPQLVIDLLLEFGSRQHDGLGAEICYFDKKAKKRLHTYAGELAGKLGSKLDAYLVVSGDRVITTGSRFKRINRA
jgi:hypothetical protein